MQITSQFKLFPNLCVTQNESIYIKTFSNYQFKVYYSKVDNNGCQYSFTRKYLIVEKNVKRTVC